MFVLGFIAINAYAGGASNDHVPSYVEVTSEGGIIIETIGAWGNPDACSNKTNRIFIPATNVFLDRYYAAVLTAISRNYYLWAWVDECTTMPWGETYATVINMGIRAK